MDAITVLAFSWLWFLPLAIVGVLAPHRNWMSSKIDVKLHAAALAVALSFQTKEYHRRSLSAASLLVDSGSQ